jgi:hypothetical protein
MSKSIVPLHPGWISAPTGTTRNYVALQQIKLGSARIAPGTAVAESDLAGRNIGQMIRNGHIQEIIEAG